MKKRYMLKVAYDGTAYCGFQVQTSHPTVEGELNRCISELLGEEIKVIGASRTDTGVHALCNVAVFDADTEIPAPKLAYALNQRLPEDIRIRASREVAADFHPRHCNARKTYEYRITRGNFPIPTKRLYSYFTYHVVNVAAMEEAAAYLVGEHDFKSFCAAATDVDSTVRTIYSITVEEQDEDVVIRVCGSGFLYNMVRIIVGTLLEIGQGKRLPESIQETLSAKDRRMAGPTVPACGLMLVDYVFLGKTNIRP